MINHSHRKSAEKVTWQITQIGNSAGCLSWQWLIRKIKDDWKVILTFSLFAFSVASMFYLELQGLAEGETGIRRREVRTGGMKCKKNVSQCLSFFQIYSFYCPNRQFPSTLSLEWCWLDGHFLFFHSLSACNQTHRHHLHGSLHSAKYWADGKTETYFIIQVDHYLEECEIQRGQDSAAVAA